MKIITLCGSTKFKKEYEESYKKLSLQGNIVISTNLFSNTDGDILNEEQLKILKEIHKKKIDISDEIFVINVGGYIGKDTQEEIDYANSKGKTIEYFEPYTLPLEKNVKIKKTNKVKYISKGTILGWTINDNNLNVKVEGNQINIRTFLKILIQEIEQLKHFEYRRISPYKLKHEFASTREDRNHVFSIQFIDIKDDNKIKTSEVIRTNWCMAIEEGTYSYFIPDLLEVAIDRKLVTLNENIYKYREQSFRNPVEINYIDNDMSREKLISEGWQVPSRYSEPYINKNNLIKAGENPEF